VDACSGNEQERKNKADDLTVPFPVQVQEELNEGESDNKQNEGPKNHGRYGNGKIGNDVMHALKFCNPYKDTENLPIIFVIFER
jgi:hypothetical protein